ncbi:DUF1911 domain-containing protein [Catenovulum sp. SM1970]|uniref:PoNe immunity protein domain-containing protein n=1 Tax=Marinifaba aquimaris TaxID=2741323 RepID=UPI00157288CD|nr:DUF1911 domain-containing protein [Marinifaba aquimaris]
MLRDTLKDKNYYDNSIEFSIECLKEDIDDVNYEDKFNYEVKMNTAFGLVRDSMELLHLKYSRGDNLAEFKPLLLETLTYRQWQKKFADALPPNEQVARISKEELGEHKTETLLQWLAFSYCLNMGQDYYQQVLNLIANQGQDGLLDNLAIAMGDTGREVAENPLFKKRFGKLHKVVIAEPAQRPQLLKTYLDAWYKLYGSPDLHLMDTDTYKGYWCWEAALVVKLYNIDDSSFIDHEYYPKDLVHWPQY